MVLYGAYVSGNQPSADFARLIAAIRSRSNTRSAFFAFASARFFCFLNRIFVAFNLLPIAVCSLSASLLDFCFQLRSLFPALGAEFKHYCLDFSCLDLLCHIDLLAFVFLPAYPHGVYDTSIIRQYSPSYSV